MINLIDYQQNGFGRLPQPASQFFIHRREALLSVDQKQQEIAVANCHVDRLTHMGCQLSLANAADAPGIPQREWSVAGRTGCRKSVSGDSGLIMHNRRLSTNQS